MNREQRLGILGQDLIDAINAEVDEEPPPSAMDIEILRRIFAGAKQRADGTGHQQVEPGS